MLCRPAVASDLLNHAGQESLSYSRLMHASWLLRSARGQAPVIELPGMRLLSGRAPAGQAKVPTMQV